MKFLYEYRTKDNVHHDGVINAASREAAFDALRSKGIKPGRLVEAPGFFNKLFGKGKRWIAIGVLTAVCLALCFALRAMRSALDVPQFCERGQIVGDVSIITEGIRCGWTNVLSQTGDQLLAVYAQPGILFGKAPIDQRYPQFDDALAHCVHKPLVIDRNDRVEYRHLKQIVNGMRRELDEYLRSGGNFRGYQRRLNKRFLAEKAERDRIVADFNRAIRGKSEDVVFDLWQDANARLRHLGLKSIELPNANSAQ